MKRYFELFGHTCELEVREESRKGVDWLRKTLIDWITVDPTSNQTVEHFNSHATIINERKRHLQSYPVTVHPFSRFKFLWEVMMTVVFLVGLIYAPLLFLFYFDHTVESSIGNLSIMISVKVFCILDMTMRFFTGYWDDENFTVSF